MGEVCCGTLGVWGRAPGGDDGAVRSRKRPRDERPDLARNLPRFIALTAVVYVPLIAWYLAAEIDALRGVS